MGRKVKGRLNPEMPDLALDPQALAGPKERRDRLFQMRLTASELAEIRSTARSLKLTVTEYLVGLHGQATAALRRKGGR